MHRVRFPPIAIVGLSGRLPGATSIESFWKALARGGRLVQDFSFDELRGAGVSECHLTDPCYVPSYGLLSGALEFDFEYFGLSESEASVIDPQHRKFLECSAEALADAWPDENHLAARTGVFAGCIPSVYVRFLDRCATEVSIPQLNVELGNHQDFLASRVAWHLGLNGPAVNINAACATSLFALHAACTALHRGDCDQALVGAASIRQFFPAGYLAHPGGVNSADGRCCPFDVRAGGTVFGDGVMCVVLRRAEDVARSGQASYGMIVGSAIGNDGADRPSFAAPSPEGQRRVLEQAHSTVAGRVSYIEAHGTGTILGDEIELAAMRGAFGGIDRDEPIYIGSVKANCGHLDAAAGLAGVMKVLGAFSSGVMPETINVSSPRPDVVDGPIRLSVEPLPAPDLAGVSSFGMGGHSAHVVLSRGVERLRETAPRSLKFRRTVCPIPGMLPKEERSDWREVLTLYGKAWEAIELPPAEHSPQCVLLHHGGRDVQAFCGRLGIHDIDSISCPIPSGEEAANPEFWRRLFTMVIGAEGGCMRGRILVDLGPITDATTLPSAGATRRWLARQAGLLQAIPALPICGLLTLVFDPAQGHADHAAMIALNLAARQERPSFPVSTLEVGGDLEQFLPALLVQAANIVRIEPHLKFESGGWFVETFVPVQAEARTPALVMPESVCVVVGGTGQIGSALSEMLASSFGCQVVATGSTPESVARGASRGDPNGRLQTKLLRVEDEVAVELVFSEITEQFGRLDLVIHCASCPGEECYRSIEETTAAALSRILTPKVAGTASLAAVLRNRPHTRLLAISSLASELAGLSLGSYASACRYQDAVLDYHRHSLGLPWISVNLDHWELEKDSPETTRPEATQGPRIGHRHGLAFFRDFFSHAPLDRMLVSRSSLPERAERWLRRSALPGPSGGTNDAAQKRRGRGDSNGGIVRRLVGEYCPGGEVRDGQSLSEMGIDSLAAMDLALTIQSETGLAVSAAELHAAADIGNLIARLESRSTSSASLVSVMRSGSRRSHLVLIHPHGGGIGLYQALVNTMNYDGEILGVRAQGLFGEAPPLASVEEMAARYLQDLGRNRVQELTLLGFSAGGLVASEMARQLHVAGRTLRGLILLDALPPAGLRDAISGETLDEVAFLNEVFLGQVELPDDELRCLPQSEADLAAMKLWREAGLVSNNFSLDDLAAWRKVFNAGLRAYTTWDASITTNASKLLIRGAKQTGGYSASEPDLGWMSILGSDLEIYPSPAEHHEILSPPFVVDVAAVIDRFLTRI